MNSVKAGKRIVLPGLPSSPMATQSVICAMRLNVERVNLLYNVHTSRQCAQCNVFLKHE